MHAATTSMRMIPSLFYSKKLQWQSVTCGILAFLRPVTCDRTIEHQKKNNTQCSVARGRLLYYYKYAELSRMNGLIILRYGPQARDSSPVWLMGQMNRNCSSHLRLHKYPYLWRHAQNTYCRHSRCAIYSRVFV